MTSAAHPPAIPFHVPPLGAAERDAAIQTLDGGWITTGAQCRAFEAEFADRLGGDGLQAIAVNSGTAALHLALEAVGIGPGDLVVVPGWTFTASAEVVRYLGADPLLVDVDESDFCIRPETVAARVDSLPEAEQARVKAVMPVHFAGLGCDMQGFEQLCRARGWKLVDDAAHALPTRSGDRWVGTVGDATAFSFYATKTLCTGEGGMVVTGDPALADRMRTMRLHGINRDAFDRYRSQEPAWYYEVVAPGFKYNLTDLAAAIGRVQLDRLDVLRDARAAIARQYSRGFATVEGLTTPPDAPGPDGHAWHLYALRVTGGRAVRDATIEELAGAQIGTSVHFIPLHLHPYWRDRYGLRPENLPVCTRLFEQEISLPLYPAMTEDQVLRVIAEVPAAFQRARRRVLG